MGFFDWLFGRKSKAAGNGPVGAPGPTAGAGTGSVSMTHATPARTISGPLAPEHWAAVLGTGERLASLEGVVLAYFKARNRPARLDAGVVSVGSDHQYGLENIVRMCAGAPEDEWRGLVASHFDVIGRAEARDASSETLASVRERLVVRLWDDRVDALHKVDVVRRVDVPGLFSVLSIDYPESVTMVNRDMAARWGLNDEQLFAIAMTNTLRLAQRELRTDYLQDLGLYATEGETVFVSSLLLSLESTEVPACEHGAIVGVPARTLLLAMPLTGPAALTNIQHVIALTAKIESETAGAVSGRVWWTKDGKFEELHYEIAGGQLELMPGPELTAALQRATEAWEAEGEPGGSA